MNFLSISAGAAAPFFAGLLLTTAAPRCLAIAGDNFADAVDLGSAIPAVHVRPADAALTLETGEQEDVSGSHWLTWVCPAAGVYEARGTYPKERTSGLYVSGLDPVVKVYTGDSLAALSQVPHIPLGIVSEPKRFRAAAGQRYRFRTGLTPFGGFIGNFSNGVSAVSLFGFASGDFTFTLTKQAVPPPNDDFAHAEVVPAGTDVTVTGTNAGATNEPGESLGPYEAGDTVWHRWTAPEAGSYELFLSTPAFVRVAVFAGEGLGALLRTQGAQPNYNDPALGTARLRWQAEAGDIRFLRLSGNGYAQQGAYTLRLRRLTPPANDQLADAIPLSGDLPLTVSGTTESASAEPGVDAGTGSSSSIWWKWTAPATGWREWSGNAAVGILADGAPLGYTLENHTPLRFLAVAGKVYHLRAATPEAAEKTVTLTLRSFTGLEHATPETALDMGAAAAFSSPTLLVPGGLFAAPSGGVAEGALWCRWTAPAGGWVALDTEGSSPRPRLSIRAASAPQAELRPSTVSFGTLAATRGAFVNFPAEQNVVGRNWWMPVSTRRPLPERLLQDTLLAPDTDRLLFRVTAGQTYLIGAVSSLYSDLPPGPVKISLRPAAGPPSVLAVRLRDVPPATPRDAHLLEAVVSVSSPNGLVRGGVDLLGQAVYFTDADRVSGDAWAGEYRVTAPLPNGYALAGPPAVSVTLVDSKGGVPAPGAASPLNITARPATLADLTADFLAPMVEGGITATAGTLSPLVPVPAADGSSLVTISLNGQALTRVFRLGIRDFGGGGFASGVVHIEGDANRRFAETPFGAAQRVGGDALLGIYEVTVTIPAHARGQVMCRLRDAAGNVAGRWLVDQPGLVFIDSWGGTPVPNASGGGTVVNYSFIDSIPLPYEVISTGPEDTAPPVISDTAVILDGAGNVRLYARITDDLSGVGGGAVLLVDKHGLVEARSDFTAAQRTGGTALDGRYEMILPAPRHGFGGAHYVSLRAVDQVGRAAEARLIGPVTLPDRTAEDQRRPRLTRFQISPAAVNLTAGPAELSVSIGAGDDRPGLTAVCRIFDSAGVLLAEQQVGCNKPVLDCVATITLPPRPLIGRSAAARVELELTDSAGRVETYGQPASPAWPDDSTVSLTLGAASDPFALWAASWPGLPALAPDATRDTDRDGVPDLLEFALGTDPLALPANDIFRAHIPELTVPPHFAVVDPEPGQASPVIIVHQFSPAPAFSRTGDAFTNGPWKLRMEESTNLLNWTPVPLVDRFADTGVVHTSRTATAQDPRRMFRLMVSP